MKRLPYCPAFVCVDKRRIVSSPKGPKEYRSGEGRTDEETMGAERWQTFRKWKIFNISPLIKNPHMNTAVFQTFREVGPLVCERVCVCAEMEEITFPTLPSLLGWMGLAP